MTGHWAGSNRRDTLPPDWPARRIAVLRRDGHRCTWRTGPISDGQTCGKPANQVDHTGHPDDHRLEKLRALCEPHHNRKSSAQGNAARAARAAQRLRPVEPHPGLRRGG